jgi:hypothetical protein
MGKKTLFEILNKNFELKMVAIHILTILLFYFSFTYIYLFFISIPAMILFLLFFAGSIKGSIEDYQDENWESLSSQEKEKYIIDNPNSRVVLDYKYKAEIKRRNNERNQEWRDDILAIFSQVQSPIIINTLNISSLTHITKALLDELTNEQLLAGINLKEETFHNQRVECYNWLTNDGIKLTLEQIKEQFKWQLEIPTLEVFTKAYEQYPVFVIFNDYCFYIDKTPGLRKNKFCNPFSGNLGDRKFKNGEELFTKSNKVHEQENSQKTNNENILLKFFPKLSGIELKNISYEAKGNNPEDFFTSDIDGSWYYAQSQMVMLFKAVSKDKINKELRELLDSNKIDVTKKIIDKNFEYWNGDGFKIEHPIMGGVDIIIITNENLVPENSLQLRTTDLATKVNLPTGYENIIRIENVYDGDEFLKGNNGQISLNVPLLFKDSDDLNYILIGISTLGLAKKIIDDIMADGYGKENFNKLEDNDSWEYVFSNKFFVIGYLSEYRCVRINMLHNLIAI